MWWMVDQTECRNCHIRTFFSWLVEIHGIFFLYGSMTVPSLASATAAELELMLYHITDMRRCLWSYLWARVASIAHGRRGAHAGASAHREKRC